MKLLEKKKKKSSNNAEQSPPSNHPPQRSCPPKPPRQTPEAEPSPSDGRCKVPNPIPCTEPAASHARTDPSHHSDSPRSSRRFPALAETGKTNSCRHLGPHIVPKENDVAQLHPTPPGVACASKFPKRWPAPPEPARPRNEEGLESGNISNHVNNAQQYSIRAKLHASLSVGGEICCPSAATATSPEYVIKTSGAPESIPSPSPLAVAEVQVFCTSSADPAQPLVVWETQGITALQPGPQYLRRVCELTRYVSLPRREIPRQGIHR